MIARQNKSSRDFCKHSQTTKTISTYYSALNGAAVLLLLHSQYWDIILRILPRMEQQYSKYNIQEKNGEVVFEVVSKPATNTAAPFLADILKLAVLRTSGTALQHQDASKATTACCDGNAHVCPKDGSACYSTDSPDRAPSLHGPPDS
jgi:hypothetical protein